MKIGIQIGVCESQGAEAAIIRAGKAGVRGIELFDWDIAAYAEKPEALHKALKDAGIELSGMYFSWPPDLKPAREAEAVQKAINALDFLQKAGCKFIVLNGGPGKPEGHAFTNEDFKALAQWSNRIGAEARNRQMQAVIHPHYKCMVETNDDVEHLVLAGLDRGLVGLCVHAGHQLVKGADPYEMYEKQASWVRYAHISDHADTEGKGEFIGKGILDQRRLMDALLKGGFDGWIIIESRKEGVSPEKYAAETIAYLQSTWPGLRWE